MSISGQFGANTVIKLDVAVGQRVYVYDNNAGAIRYEITVVNNNSSNPINIRV